MLTDLPLGSTPHQMPIMLHSQHLLNYLELSTPSVWIILYLLLEIFVVQSLPHQISTQGISLRMPCSWSVDDLKTIVL
jgi:hypothetical protein